MKKLILFELALLFLATTFMTDSPPPGWYQQTLPRTDITVQDIFFLDSLKGWVTANKYATTDTAFIYYTTNGGVNWAQQFIGSGQYGLTLNRIQFLDINTGYVVGAAGFGKVFKTTNGGVLWQDIFSYSFGTFTDLTFVNKDTGWVCSDDILYGGLLKKINGGTSWQQQIGAGHDIGKIFFLNKDTGWATGIHDTLLRTTNGGANWNFQYNFNTGIGSIFFTTKDTGFIAGSFGSYSIVKTTDGGFTWNPTSNSFGGRGLYFKNNTTGWLCDIFSTLQKTTDHGDSWFNQTVPTGDYYSIMFADTTKGWAGGTKVIHTTDGGGPPLGILYGSSKADEYRLDQNFPNPFNSTTIIIFQIREKSTLELKIFDITGKEVKTLLDDDHYTSGTYQFGYDGSRLSSGVYFYRLIVRSEVSDKVFTDTKKMVLLK